MHAPKSTQPRVGSGNADTRLALQGSVRRWLGRVEDWGLSSREQRGCCGRDMVRRRWCLDEDQKEGLGCRSVWREEHGGGGEVKGQGSRCRATGVQPLATEKIWTPHEDSGTHATTAEVSSCDRDHVVAEPNILTTWPIPEVCGPLV